MGAEPLGSSEASREAAARAPQAHQPRQREDEAGRREELLPVHRVVGVLQEVGGLLVNQAVGVTRGAGRPGSPRRGHGDAARQKQGPEREMGWAGTQPRPRSLPSHPKESRNTPKETHDTPRESRDTPSHLGAPFLG